MDVLLAVVAGMLLLLPMLAIAALVRLTSAGPALYWSDRVGHGNRIFRMPKFRSMRTDAPEVAAHLLTRPDAWITPVGRFLRATSLDELPQLWCILLGEMSFVGPRPALFNQYDLIAERTAHSVHKLRPGLTGWAQINGRDELTVVDKTAYDAWYLQHASFLLDLKIILLTAGKMVHRGSKTRTPRKESTPPADLRKSA
ncbi:MAG: sugar transferase [Pirellulales bacterium]